jgi:phosphatidylinositol kinase/protein kinase (PI-3  family)
MDNIWLQAGYDFKMSIYRVLPIGNMVGYIEVVENSETNSKIHK